MTKHIELQKDYIIEYIQKTFVDKGMYVDWSIHDKRATFGKSTAEKPHVHLFGNIEINAKGSFIRVIESGGRKHKEGIYSLIMQNERHFVIYKGKHDRKLKSVHRCFVQITKKIGYCF